MQPWNLSPVFLYECALCARRWQTYAARTLFLAALLVSLTAVWVLRLSENPGGFTLNGLAAIGEAFFVTIAGTQLVLVLLAAPAYTAGSICLDKARGTLTYLLVTDLTAAEIVVGKLGAHGLPVLGLLLAGLPVLVLATFLGGIEPEAVLGSFCVTVAVALVGCTVALALSVWGNKPHEVLLATYLVEVVWLLGLPLWYGLRPSVSLGPAPAWLEILNPFALLFAPYLRSASSSVGDYAFFVGSCASLSALLTFVAILTLRRAARRDGGRSAPGRHYRFPCWLHFGPTLDANPVLWREWHRRLPSRWLRVIWGMYALLSVGASVVALATGSRSGGELPAFVNGFQFSIGLLLVAVTTVASLFEERVNGSLDMLLTTPLPAAWIVWGKWWVGFRMVALVALLPTLLAGGLCVQQGRAGSFGLLVLLIALLFAYGALVNSLALALATWVPRFGVAVGLTVAIYVLLAAGSVLLLFAAGHASEDLRGFASISPWYGVGETTFHLSNPNHHPENLGWKGFWLLLYGAVALALVNVTQRSFDRCLGRVSSQP